MANKIKEIKEFFSGIISSFSSSDIKDDAASFSLNVDSSDKDGVIAGVKESRIKINSEEIQSATATTIESSDGKFDLVYGDINDGSIKVVEDIYGGSTVKIPENSSAPGGSPSAMETNNKKVFAGYGKELKPKIIYRTKHKPFKEPDTEYSNWIYENSTVYNEQLLNSSFSVDRFLGVPGSTDDNCKTLVGIRYDHKDVYFGNFRADFNTATKVFDFHQSNKSAKIDLGLSNDGKGKLLGSACDICQADVKNYGEDIENGNTPDYFFWVLSTTSDTSEGTSNSAIVQKFKLNALPDDTETNGGGETGGKCGQQIQFTVDFGDNPEDAPPEGAVPASILETKNKLWIQYWKPNGDSFETRQAFLWCADIPTANGHILFKNKSLYYDKITKHKAKFRTGWIKALSEQLQEWYFRSDDESHHGITNTDWNKGDEEWNDAGSKRGQHYYSGLYQPDGTGFKIARHGLIQSPLVDTATGESPDFINSRFPDWNIFSDEDWIAVIGQCTPSALNIYTAQEYKVAATYFLGVKVTDSYKRLRAADDSGSGSNVMGGGGSNFMDFLNGLWENILYLIFTVLIGGISALLQSGLGLVNPSVMVRYLNDLIYGDDSVNWFYNGKCFEGGVLNNVVINIGSKHNPKAKFDINSQHSEGPARVHLRELYGFNSDLEIVCVRHYMNRLIFSCYQDSEDEEEDNSTLFLMYDTSEFSLANQYDNQIGPVVIDPVRIEENASGDEEWYDVAEQLRDATVIPNLYTDLTYFGGSGLDKRPNKIIQAYLPVVDNDILTYGLYPEIDSDNDIWPFTNPVWWQTQDGALALKTNTLLTEDDYGKIYKVARASFNIFLKPGAYFDGRSYQHIVPGWSNQTTLNDHLGFVSTTGAFNVAKFNFIKIKNTTLNQYTDLGVPENAESLYPDNELALIDIATEPNTPTHNIKQFSLDSKSLSFKVKATTFTGSNKLDAPFIYDASLGQKEIYRYKINLVYDGYQDSPLSNHYTEVDIRDATVRADGESDPTVDYTASALAVTINLHKPELVTRRITHVRLWKSRTVLYSASDDSGKDDFNIAGMYTLVETIPLKSNWAVTDEVVEEYGGETVTLGLIAKYTVIDNGKVGPSYEAYTGIPQAMKKTLPSYKLSTQLNNFLYIGNCKHPSYEDASNLIFRSQPNRFSIFDWSEHVLSLPSSPKALTSFNGRVIAWDFKNMYIINPDGLYIEDTFESAGCIDENHFARTETGICFADEKNIYLYDGREVKNIGIPVITSHKYGKKISWRDRSDNYPTIMKYNSQIRSFCIFFKVDEQTDVTWLQRAEGGKYYFNRLDNTFPDTLRWFQIPHANINWELGEEHPKYIFHRKMWENYFQGHEDQSISQSDIEDYYYEPYNITLPYGCGYEVATGRYIADLPAMLYGLGWLTLDENLAANTNQNSLHVLQEFEYPSIGEIFKDGKFIAGDKDGYYCFTYNIDKQRWDLIQVNEFNGVFGGPKGELYTSSKISEDFILNPDELDEATLLYLSNGKTNTFTPIGGREQLLTELTAGPGPETDLMTETQTGQFEQIHNAKIYSLTGTPYLTQVYSPNGQYLDTDRDGDLNDEVPNMNDYNGQYTYPAGYYNMNPQWMPGDVFSAIKVFSSNGEEIFSSGLNQNIDVDTFLNHDHNPEEKLRLYRWLVPVNNFGLTGWPDMTPGDTVIFKHFVNNPELNGPHKIMFRGESFTIASQTFVPFWFLEDWNLDCNFIDEPDAGWEFNGPPVPPEIGDLQFLRKGIGDLNKDGGVNLIDLTWLIAQNLLTYIVIKGWDLEPYRIIMDYGQHAYPYLYIIDENSSTNYHKLEVYHAYFVKIENVKYTYCLIPRQSYPYFGNVGWNLSSQSALPENTKVAINPLTTGLDGDSVLRVLFGSKDKKQFTYISKNFSLSGGTVNKLISKIKITYNNTPPLFEYMINNDDRWIIPDVTQIEDDGYCLSYKVPKMFKKAKSIKLKIIAQPKGTTLNYDTEVDSFSIIYRERGNA